MKRCLSWCLATLALLVLTACSTPTAVADTDDFRWMGTVVAGLSETGEQAEELVIPASATEVSLDLTGNTVLRRLSFESDDTVIRNLILGDRKLLRMHVAYADYNSGGRHYNQWLCVLRLYISKNCSHARECTRNWRVCIFWLLWARVGHLVP